MYFTKPFKTQVMADLNLKILHIIISKQPLERNGKNYEGLIYDFHKIIGDKTEDRKALCCSLTLDKVDVSLIAESFFKTETDYKLTCLETEMIPEDLQDMLKDKFNVESKAGLQIPGAIMSFLIKESKLDALWKDLTENPNTYLVKS